MFKDMKRSGLMGKVKRKFKNKLCSSESFFFSSMTKEDTLEMIKMLKKG
jgi:hypothetical protein